MPADAPRWRSSASYDYIDGLDAPDLAWELLRRNGDYQRDYAEIEQDTGGGGPLVETARQRWRLHHPRQPRLERDRDIHFLAAGS